MPKKFGFKYLVVLLMSVMLMSSQSFAQSAFEDPGSSASGAGGDLAAVSNKVDGGAVRIGTTAQVLVLLRNDAGKPLKPGAITLVPSSNITAAVGENQCAAIPIEPGEVCPISIQVKGLQQGAYRVEMLVRHDGKSKLLTLTIAGTVESSGDEATDLVSDIEAIPSDLDFGTLNQSQEQVKALVLRNKTSKSIKIEDIQIQAGDRSGYSVDKTCDELQTGEACVVSVHWSPAQKGTTGGTVIISHSGPTRFATVEVKGSYDPDKAEIAQVFPEAVPGKGLLVSSKESIDFGSGVSQSSSITVSLVNTGGVPLSLTGIKMSNTDNGIKVESSGCKSGVALAPFEACPLTLTWEPVREGNIVDDVQIAHTGARGILVMPLRGNAAKAINKDTQAIDLTAVDEEDFLENIRPLSVDDIGEDVADEKSSSKSKKEKSEGGVAIPEEAMMERALAKKDVRGALEGYSITSYSARRAIISGPGGSRVVFEGEQSVIGGVLWEIKMRPSAVEFHNGDQKVLLLFDKSLSSVNVVDTQSSSAASSTTAATTSSSSTTTQ